MGNKPRRRLWGEPYNIEGCQKAWRLYYERFNNYTHRAAAKLAGVNVAEMYCFGIDFGLVDPDTKAEARTGLKQLQVIS